VFGKNYLSSVIFCYDGGGVSLLSFMKLFGIFLLLFVAYTSVLMVPAMELSETLKLETSGYFGIAEFLLYEGKRAYGFGR